MPPYSSYRRCLTYYGFPYLILPSFLVHTIVRANPLPAIFSSNACPLHLLGLTEHPGSPHCLFHSGNSFCNTLLKLVVSLVLNVHFFCAYSVGRLLGERPGFHPIQEISLVWHWLWAPLYQRHISALMWWALEAHISPCFIFLLSLVLGELEE